MSFLFGRVVSFDDYWLGFDFVIGIELVFVGLSCDF